MHVSFEIDIAPEDEAALVFALNCEEQTLNSTISKHAKAAITEYLEGYLGRRVFSRGSDIMEHRLALLVEHAFEALIPDDASISRLFQTTPSASRTLIRNALSKYRYQLQSSMDHSAKSLLETATWSGEKFYHAQIKTTNLIELLNQRLISEDPTQKPITRLVDSVSTYAIGKHSYDLLCIAFHAVAVERE